MSATLNNMQGIRSVNKNGPTPSTHNANEVIYVDILTDPVSKAQFILWDDIRQVFDNALLVRHQARALLYMKGDDYSAIAAIPGVVLDVYVDGPLVGSEVTSNKDSTPTSLPISPQAEKGAFQTNTTVRRNPQYGLVEEALENYTHIENPLTAPRLRGPQLLPEFDDEGESTPTSDNVPEPQHQRQSQRLPNVSNSHQQTPPRDLNAAPDEDDEDNEKYENLGFLRNSQQWEKIMRLKEEIGPRQQSS
ncbi:hypothetical protein BGZ96_001911 [Linnemannia gamsii]|uniref:Nucleic acid-binding protein n=1 Tax=Linnemannia gamsii TaxID=64522 RepID=A0ABQ7K9V7_9FUNG|nr:hypothetical protein BGZ96_001911 [Linnemannia gamsii]